MSDPDYQQELTDQVAKREQRKIAARRDQNRGIWFGLGMFGVVGWSITLPTLAAIAVGIWLDKAWPSRISWTLTSLFVGVVIGCWIAWYWIKREVLDEK